jgi:hypothetical protein
MLAERFRSTLRSSSGVLTYEKALDVNKFYSVLEIFLILKFRNLLSKMT